MYPIKAIERLRFTGLVSVILLGIGSLAANAQAPGGLPDEIHFLIPAGPNSGWDVTALATGEALTEAGLLENVSYENKPGGGGGKAIEYLIENADANQNTLMVNSTPIILHSLQGHFPYSFRDLTPIAATIGDYGAFAVRADSPLQTWQEVLDAYRTDPDALMVAGGSPVGGLDYLVAAHALHAAGADLSQMRYAAYDGGGNALNGLLLGQAELLSTSLGEVLKQAEAGKLRILAITAPERIEEAPEVPTLKELGYDVEFVNWRGFFGAPGLPEARADAYAELLGKLVETAAWKEVHERNAWVNLYKPRAEFVAFLEAQEQALKSLLNQLGMETVR